MNILMLSKAYPPVTGGVETYSEQVAIAYTRAGHNVTVLTTHSGSVGEAICGAVRVINVGQMGGQLAVFLRMLLRLWELRSESYDFIHATTWRVALPVMMLRPKLPMTLTIHGREVFVVPGLLRPLMRWALRHADHIPTVSQPILDKVQKDLGVLLDTAFANHNGISFEQESIPITAKPKGRVELLCMCRLVRRKNLRGAIHAVAGLVAKGYDIRFRIAGSGEEASHLQTLIRELSLEDHVLLLGRVPATEVEQLYRSSHIFLHPQITTRDGGDLEGFGLSIADGMAFGCVPVAGASGGPMDFILDGETGYLVDGTKINLIAAALERLITDVPKREAMAKAAKLYAHEKLTWESHVGNILKRQASTSVAVTCAPRVPHS